ncbi:dTDP-glucose 4,6-dehydratase [Halobacteriovorax marinus]|uniref:dTDP-glucose 4,6-dehydratase n=1 Tax=Halobacteriovorax marinus TaxID=97084 RepID=A0A1Y5FGI2_9BACT|nr:dTDP-glucose 4,6-dehydratase [Halobacteriovorax marinus]
MGKKTVLLTGCAGFIGSNFVKRICTRKAVQESYNFVILDALTYAGHYQNIQNEVEQFEHITFVKGDIRNQNLLNDLFSETEFQGIMHFAAESHVDRSIESPNIFIETNVLGTLNLLNVALKTYQSKGDFKFLHVSTDEVYGQLGLDDPAFHEETPIDPSSPYSSSKASSDLLVRSYTKTYGLPTIVTRCSNNYGAFQFPEKFIPVIALNALSDKSLPVYGKGENIRDWIHVEDHVDGLWSAFENGKSGSVYNFGGNSEFKNIDVVKMILEILEKPESLISYVEDRLGHDFRYAIDFTKTANELQWQPKRTFEEGLKETVEWYKNNTEWINQVKG